MFKVLVCGDRNWTDRDAIRRELDLVMRAIDAFLPQSGPIVVIEGEYRGADLLGREVAESLGLAVEPYAADWTGKGPAAGPIRNQRMLVEGKPNFVLAFHADIEHSKGTKDMVRRATKAGVVVKVVTK